MRIIQGILEDMVLKGMFILVRWKNHLRGGFYEIEGPGKLIPPTEKAIMSSTPWSSS